MANYLKLGRNLATSTKVVMFKDKKIDRPLTDEMIKYLSKVSGTNLNPKKEPLNNLEGRIFSKITKNYFLAGIHIKDSKGKQILKGAYSVSIKNNIKTEKFHFTNKNNKVFSDFVEKGYSKDYISAKYDTNNPLLMELANTIKSLLDKGYKVNDIKAEIGIDTTKIYNIIRRFKIKTHLERLNERFERDALPDIKKGINVQEILKKHNMASRTYYRLLKDHNILSSKKFAEHMEKNQIMEMMKQGKDSKEISQELNMSLQSLYYRQRKYRLNIDYDKRFNDAAKDFETFVKEGHSRDKICKQFDISPFTYYKWIYRLNLEPSFRYRQRLNIGR